MFAPLILAISLIVPPVNPSYVGEHPNFQPPATLVVVEIPVISRDELPTQAPTTPQQRYPRQGAYDFGPWFNCIVEHESGWNPQAQNPTSTASGMFQFLDSTWQGLRRELGWHHLPDRALHASVADQYAMAQELLRRYGRTQWVTYTYC